MTFSRHGILYVFFTTKRAYDELEQEGLVISVSGKGTFVSSTNKESIREIKYRALEEHIKKIIVESRAIGLTNEQLKDLLTILDGEENV